MSGPWTLADNISETAFQGQIEALCRELGVRWHHETDSRRSPKGWPDLALCGPGGVAFAELKKQAPTSTLTDRQAEWLAAIVQSRGVVGCVWRPADFRHIALVLHRLAGRRPHALLLDGPPIPRFEIAYPDARAAMGLRHVGDFSTRADAERVRVAMTDPTTAEVLPRPRHTERTR